MICADSALDKIGFGRFQWTTMILSGIGFGAATVELLAVSQIKPFIKMRWNLDSSEMGIMSTATFLGEIIGGIVWAQLSDTYGRERVFLATSLLMFIFSLILPFCWTFPMFCWMRLFLGFAIGGGLSVDFVYFIECIPPRNRSFRSAFIILIGIFGVLYTAVCGLIQLNRYGYQVFLMSCSIPSAILLVGRLFWRFESPKYLIAKGRFKEAEELLVQIAKINGSTHYQKNHFELAEKTTTTSNPISKEGFKSNFYLIFLASVTFFCQTSAYYGLTLWIWMFLGSRNITPSFMFLLIGLAEIPGLIVTSLFLKYYPSASRFILATVFGLSAILGLIIYFVTDIKAFIFMFCCLYCCIVSIWTILYGYIPEGFPTLYRSRCFAVAGTFGKIGGMLSPILFGWLFQETRNRLIIHLIISGLFMVGAIASINFKH